MNAPLPKISIITPSFNQGQYIRENIESVLNQNYPNFEHIVVDGGSTDETVEILREYPHVIWSSEKDDGQSDALNKGLAKATGEIIGWLNSDDWYGEMIFHEIAFALQDYPIVLGNCDIRDGDKNLLYTVENKPRTWFNLVKYWVPYSIPTQPAIFMKRSILDENRRGDENIIDPSLYYCMDYDLWLRLCQKYPLTKKINRVLAHYRMTEDNKTGEKTEGMPYAEPEMSRLFRRHTNSIFSLERDISYVIPVDEVRAESLDDLLAGLTLQSVQCSEIIVVGQNLTRERQKEVKRKIREINDRCLRTYKPATISFRNSVQEGLVSAINFGINDAAGGIVAVLGANVGVGSNLSETLLNIFSLDKIGFAYPLRANHSLWQQSGEGKELQKLLFAEDLPPIFAARKVTLFELDGLDELLPPAAAMRKGIQSIWECQWHISLDNGLPVVLR